MSKRDAFEEEIASLEAQMGTASSYAAAGLKRRLQTLKAVALREERAARARAQGERSGGLSFKCKCTFYCCIHRN